MKGTIVKLGNGFGFIHSDDHPEEIFFHVSELTDLKFGELKVGDHISFELNEENQLAARKVEKLPDV